MRPRKTFQQESGLKIIKINCESSIFLINDLLSSSSSCSFSEMHRAQDRARVYTCLWMMALTVVACIIFIAKGKMTPREDYIVNVAQRKAKELREEGKREREKKAKEEKEIN